MAKIWIYAELSEGKLAPISLELLAKARALGGEVEAVALGKGAEAAATILGKHGAKKVYVCDDSVFDEYVAQPATDTMEALVKANSPDLLLFGFSLDSREVAGRLSARLGIGQVSSAVDVEAGGGGFTARVSYFGGSKIAKMKVNQKPAIVLIRPKSFEAAEVGGSAEVEQVKATVGADSKRAHRLERVAEKGDKVKLEDAAIVVSGGRGMQGPENFPLLEELADALGGAVGASRAVVDAGWVPYSMQVGQTGKAVRPNVYIAAGISGAMQHTVGMKASKVIIAINKDAEAPILKMADLGIVGDALKILPKLTEAVKAKKGG
ncbi:MAG TPA: electron transfer flavoprotein subunit alpha/FixB family protein [Candidatus Dormibacteraeota bacterium]|nr:electron transfer flavoprotein subunit alpha/FixB family protein [Candidatus Dormibacteraeota bacterium]